MVDAASAPFTNSTSCVINHRKKKKRGYDKSKWRLWSPAAPALGFLAIQKRQERQRLDGGHRIMETAQRCPTSIMEATCWRIKSHTTKPNLPQLLTSSHCLRIWKEHLDTCGLDATTNDHLWSCSWFDAAFSFISLFCFNHAFSNHTSSCSWRFCFQCNMFLTFFIPSLLFLITLLISMQLFVDYNSSFWSCSLFLDA